MQREEELDLETNTLANLQKHRQFARKEVLRQVSDEMKNKYSLLSEIFGKPIRPALYSNDRIIIRKKAERWIDNALDTFGPTWNTLSLNQKRKQLGMFLDKVLRSFGRVPKG